MRPAPVSLEGLPFGLVLIVSAALPLVLLGIQFWPFTVDDTYITLRYAKNLALGAGLTWNPGEPPAEGYTSLTWTLLLTPAHWFVEDGTLFAKIGSALATAGAWIVTLLCAAEVLRERAPVERLIGSFFVGLWTSLQLGTAVHAVSGMDTALFTCALMGVVLLSLRACRRPERRSFFALALACLFLGLTRPEGNVFAGALGILVATRLDRGARGTFFLAAAFGYLLPAAAYFCWRALYYGHLFPLPFYVKAVGTESFFAGAGEAAAFLYELFTVNPLSILLVALGLLRMPRALAPAACASLCLFLFFLKPVPLMAYSHRYLHPLVPFLGLLGAIGCAELPALLRRSFGGLRRAAVPLAAFVGSLTLLGALSFSLRALPGHLGEKLSYAEGLGRAHVALGRELASESASRRVALLDVGAVAYYSGWSVLDTFGLTDPFVARQGRERPDYVLGREPEYVVFVSASADPVELVFTHEAPLLAACRSAGYERRSSREFVPGYHLVVFGKETSDGASAVD